MERREQLQASGKWLRDQRERHGLSVRQLAARLDVATQVVYDWQNGKNAVSDENARRLAELWGLPEIEVRRHLGLWVPEPEVRAAAATGERIPVVVALPDGSRLTYAVSYEELERMSPDDRRRLALEVTQAVLRIDAEEADA